MTSPKTHRIAFVCSGNICRSPMAAVLADQKMTRAGISHRIISAGTLGLMNRRAADHAITAVSERGLDLSHHRSQSANSGILQVADVIVVMSPSHTAHIKKLKPALAKKILELWRFAPREYGMLTEIADPVGQDLDTFRRSRDLIAECIDGWLEKLGY